jgi:hypothetical protein
MTRKSLAAKADGVDCQKHTILSLVARGRHLLCWSDPTPVNRRRCFDPGWMVGEHASRRYGRPGNAKYLRTASPVRSSTIAFARRVFLTMESAAYS